MSNLKQQQLNSLKECSILKSEDLEIINDLMASDENDLIRDHGRKTLDLYYKSHYFMHSSTILDDISRFVKIILNHPFITPTKEEVGMMYAYYTSLRSSDLSRQVGAAILNDDGEILTTGLNEVPKFGGGLHWCDTTPDLRDFQYTNDNNEPISHEMKQNLKISPNENNQILNDSLEFIRAVHAEEAAICEAASRGVSIQDGILYCTTFPCHLCIKHIIASGIKKVVYIEPYEKSKSEDLYEGIIKDKATNKDVNILKLVPFKGVCPKRYRYVFNKRKVDRRDNKCKDRVKKWVGSTSNPIYLSHSTPISYYLVESLYCSELHKRLSKVIVFKELFESNEVYEQSVKMDGQLDKIIEHYCRYELLGFIEE